MNTKTYIVNPQYQSALANLKDSIKSDTEDAKKGPFKTSSDDRRCRLLAYCFLRGRTYLQIESNPRYLRAGFYGYDSSLRYEKERLATKIASFIPNDLGEGKAGYKETETKYNTLSHVQMWLDVGAVTRDQIVTDKATIEALHSKMTAVGAAQVQVKEWVVKMDRIARDMAHAKSKGMATTRYELDLAYIVTNRDKAIVKLEAAQAALDAAKAPKQEAA